MKSNKARTMNLFSERQKSSAYILQNNFDQNITFLLRNIVQEIKEQEESTNKIQ